MKIKLKNTEMLLLLSIILIERSISDFLMSNSAGDFYTFVLALYFLGVLGVIFSRFLLIVSCISLAGVELFVGIRILLAGEDSLMIGLGVIVLGMCMMYFVLQNLRFDLNKDSRIFLSNSSSEYAVEVIDVYKDYVTEGGVVHALRGITLKVKRGEFIAIMGPSGSGKTTLLNIIGALDRPTKGKVLIDGIDISKLNDDELSYLRNKKIGFVFQTFNLINRTSVLRNIEMPAIVAKVPRKERIKRVKKLIKIMGLDESMLSRRPVQLSGGQQQRVAIARALMNDPTIILADEPTGNLDSKTGHEIMKYLRMLNEKFGKTIIVVTHDRSVAEMANRILHIRDGKIIKEETLRKR